MTEENIVAALVMYLIVSAMIAMSAPREAYPSPHAAAFVVLLWPLALLGSIVLGMRQNWLMFKERWHGRQ